MFKQRSRSDSLDLSPIIHFNALDDDQDIEESFKRAKYEEILDQPPCHHEALTNVSYDQLHEEHMIEPFFSLAKPGEITDVFAVREDYEKRHSIYHPIRRRNQSCENLEQL